MLSDWNSNARQQFYTESFEIVDKCATLEWYWGRGIDGVEELSEHEIIISSQKMIRCFFNGYTLRLHSFSGICILHYTSKI